MSEGLSAIIQKSSNRGLPLRALSWLHNKPLWITRTMAVLGDSQLQAYFGEYQLRHFREYLSSLGQDYMIGPDAMGCYPLEISGKNVHLVAPQKPRQWDGFQNLNFSYISEIVEEAEKGLDAVCKGISDQRKVKEKVYRFALEKRDTSRLIPDSVYLRKDQVDYIQNLHPLSELDITVRQSGVYFKRENFLACIGMLNPNLFRS